MDPLSRSGRCWISEWVRLGLVRKGTSLRVCQIGGTKEGQKIGVLGWGMGRWIWVASMIHDGLTVKDYSIIEINKLSKHGV
jgi:hypothetical protein